MTETTNIEVAGTSDDVTIIGGGTLDLTNYQRFHEEIRKASLAAESITVDLRAADFIDTAVVQDLARAAVTLMKRDRRLKVVVTATAYPLRVLKISGFESIMDIEVEGAG